LKKLQKRKISFRSLLLVTLLFSFAGCATMGDFFDWVYGIDSDSSGGCSCSGSEPGGCKPRTFEMELSPFQPIGYQTLGDKPSARDMGFSQDLPAYKPITDSSSHD